MKNKILVVGLITISFIFSSCDEPKPFGNEDFIYNPFAFFQDTLNTVTAISAGSEEIGWGGHTRAWVGETQYYKSGFTVDFNFADDSLDFTLVDSIQLEIRHLETFTQDGADTLISDSLRFGFYNTTNQMIDINGSYGTEMALKALSVKTGNDIWTHTFQRKDFPATAEIGLNDTSLSLGLFPADSSALSAVYGGASTLRPKLLFYFHEPDSAGLDSATSVQVLADTLFMHIVEKTDALDRMQYEYISQLKQDSLIFSLNIADIMPGGDTLVTIDSASFWPAIAVNASAIYVPVSTDSLQRFFIRVTDPVSEWSVNLDLGADGTFYDNQINGLIQTALDDNRTTIDLILQPNHMGFDPGFVAISTNNIKSALYVKSAQAVRP